MQVKCSGCGRTVDSEFKGDEMVGPYTIQCGACGATTESKALRRLVDEQHEDKMGMTAHAPGYWDGVFPPAETPD